MSQGMLITCAASATGSLPDSFGAQGSLRNLTVLNLGNNNLTGNLPSGYGGANALQNLQVGHSCQLWLTIGQKE